MQTLVIGDIHGCYDELQDLLDRAGLSEGDRIVSIGDCVDRGPDTPAVLNFFRTQPHARLIMGNHERKHVRASRHDVKLSRSQVISRMQFAETYADALTFMDSLPLYLDLPEALVVHGYFEPGLPVEQQSPLVLCGTMGGDKHLRQRYPDPWYELYDGDKPLLVGHQNYSHSDQPFVHHDRIFGLDTDCVTGTSLTGIVLPAFRFVSVPSRANHWLKVRRLYPVRNEQLQPSPTLSEVPWDARDLEDLNRLMESVNRTAAKILEELRADPDFHDLSARKQAKRFGEKAGTGKQSALLHLARLQQLNETAARNIIKTPETLKRLLSHFSET
jgi:serine/threonine protein phosphatase 1